MCRWMGSHFHDWIDYNRVSFSIELLEWCSTFFRFFGVRQCFILNLWLAKVQNVCTADEK